MVLGLLVTLLSAQATVYEWVDETGQSHFTNLETTIPAGVHRRELSFDEPEEVALPAPAPEPEQRGAAAPAPQVLDRCEAAREELERVVEQVEDEVAVVEAELDGQQERCQVLLFTQGEGAWATCRASLNEPPPVSQALLDQLEGAREALRRAQVGGCR